AYIPSPEPKSKIFLLLEFTATLYNSLVLGSIKNRIHQAIFIKEGHRNKNFGYLCTFRFNNANMRQ
ncbi:MAG: hypothetical protein ACON5K_08325, partial [Bacteroidia bacterium]